MTHEHDAPLQNEQQQEETQPVVMSSRIRLARNLENYVHPLMFPNEEEGHRVVNEVQDALTDLRVQRLADIDQQSAYKLVAKHLISPELTKQPAAAVLLNDDESVSVMVNEEDHVRIQVMGSDLSLDTLYQRASDIDDQLDAEVAISYDETLGYLTTCPTNIGTGMRASVMLHLPGLSIMKRMNRIAQSINRFGFTIRGIYGEGSQVYGHVYQVSNQLTLGKSEQEIIDALTELVTQIINEELDVRQRLLAHKETETLDRIYRSLGILKYSRRISVEEASYRLSDIKLGVDLGVLDMPAFDFNALMIAIQSPFLIDDETTQSIESKRADILRQKL
ncbi:ATP:guanido phosphotransferase [Staphylococcus microti]|uniref:Protein-arginine kinase n=1 Tax=Staphylococcus microti TaxID=569857 RepID=A0A0D6XR36_9STAP|nr:protein arginine kinase [Staphylococcus microti]KIX91279.1 ATP:guanido phosphotransferase [Staphylococcus microti]PNZ82798.1 protein arginine kinase [Staphylococcus microti]SUM56611.1 ATP:guanido phosphotransferase YacI [Staphylococcus microti]